MYAFCCSFQKHGVDDCTVPLNIERVVLMVFTYWHWQGGAEEAVSAVEVGDMPEVEVMSTMVATGGGRMVMGVFLTKRGASLGAMLKGTDMVQQRASIRF